VELSQGPAAALVVGLAIAVVAVGMRSKAIVPVVFMLPGWVLVVLALAALAVALRR
jgi:hypothetical protein